MSYRANREKTPTKTILSIATPDRKYSLYIVVVVVVVVVNGSYSADPYSSPDRQCITKVKIKHRRST